MSESDQDNVPKLPEDQEHPSRHQRYYRKRREQILAKKQAQRDAQRVERKEPSEEERVQKKQVQREARRLANQRYAQRHPERRQAYRDVHKPEQKARNAAYYSANREVIAEKQRAHQALRKEEIAAYGKDYREKNKVDSRLKRQAKYHEDVEKSRAQNHINYQKHRGKRLEDTAQWAKENPEKRQAITARYREKKRDTLRAKGRTYAAKRFAENPEAIREKAAVSRKKRLPQLAAAMRKKRAADPERYREQQRQRRAQNPEYDKAWRKAHPDVHRLTESRRRARKRGLPDTFTKSERVFMLHYWHHACAVCSNQEGFWHILADDHWIPFSSPDCPGTVATNIIPLCHGQNGCNNSKNGQDPMFWLSSRFEPRQVKRILKAIQTYFVIVKAREASMSP